MATSGDDGKSQMRVIEDTQVEGTSEDVPTSTLAAIPNPTVTPLDPDSSAATATTAEGAVEAEPLASVASDSSQSEKLPGETVESAETSTSDPSVPLPAASPAIGATTALEKSDVSTQAQTDQTLGSESVPYSPDQEGEKGIDSKVHNTNEELVSGDAKENPITGAKEESTPDPVGGLTASLDKSTLSTNDHESVASTSAALRDEHSALTQQVVLSPPTQPEAKEDLASQASHPDPDPDQQVNDRDGQGSAGTAAPEEPIPPVPEKENALPAPPQTGIDAESGPSKAVSHSIATPVASGEHLDVSRTFEVDERASTSSSAQPIIEKPAPATPAKGDGTRLRNTSSAGIKIGKGPPPTTNPQEEKPFDFNIFLDQMKDPSARGVGEYVRSFIKGFAKKPYRTQDQIKLIFDFLDFISVKMQQCSVWSNVSETDFENAKEAMEKLVMNRLYGFTFTPAVAKEGKWTPQTDDLERDRVLKERIELFDWVTEEHLDVPKGEHSKGFVDFAIQELLKINHYKAPRDKLICILNCCKVIFGLIRHLSSEESADNFIPILILVVLKANPEHLISNVEYIGRFRNPDKLSSEAGYYLSSLMGATAFIETMDYSTLSNISQEDFERNVELAVQKIGTQPRTENVASAGTLAPAPRVPHSRSVSASDPHAPPAAGEEAARTLPGAAGPAPNFAEDTKAFFQRTGEAARMGFTNSVGKPIGALGKLFGESLDGIRTPPNPDMSAPGSAGAQTPNRADSPGPSASPGVRKSVFGGFFGADQQQQQQQARSVSGFNPASWSRGLKGVNDEDEPQTPSMTDARQGPFSSLVRNPVYSDAVPPSRKIGQAPDAPKARKGIPQRGDSIDPFNYPDISSGSSSTGVNSSPGIGTPSDGSDDEGDGDESALQRARRRLPDLGAFVPFLSADSPAPGNPPQASRSAYQHQQHLTRGPNQARPAHLGESSFLQPSSDPAAPSSGGRPGSPNLADLSADVERVHEEQMEAGVETLANVFPDTEEEVRRMVLEACNGDVGQAIDRLLEMG